MTNSEITANSPFPRFRQLHLRTLEKRGYLRRETETGRYRSWPQDSEPRRDAQANLDIADVALPFMRMLSEKIRMTVHLAVLIKAKPSTSKKSKPPDFLK